MCTLFVHDYYHNRSGLPDLTLWDPVQKTCKVRWHIYCSYGHVKINFILPSTLSVWILYKNLDIYKYFIYVFMLHFILANYFNFTVTILCKNKKLDLFDTVLMLIKIYITSNYHYIIHCFSLLKSKDQVTNCLKNKSSGCPDSLGGIV